MKWKTATSNTLIFLLVFAFEASASYKRTDSILDRDGNVFLVGSTYYRLLTEGYDPKNGKKVYKLDMRNDTKEIFYEAETNLSRLQLSPDGRYVAFVKGSPGLYGIISEMVVLRLEDKEQVASFKDQIADYRWSPDGNRIAYVHGGTIGRGVFASNGVWIYDITTKAKRKIAETARSIEWFDDNEIYVINYRKESGEKGTPDKILYESYIYDVESRKIKSRNLKGENFSIDGKYSILTDPDYRGYPVTPEEAEQIHVNFYNVQQKQIIPHTELSEILAEPRTIHWKSYIWAERNRIIFLRKIGGKLHYEIVIADLAGNKILAEFKGNIVGMNSQRNKIVIYFNGKFKTVNVP